MIATLRYEELVNRLNRQHLARKQELIEGTFQKDTLHITYVLTHVSVCGGVKIILEHANELLKLGAKITLVSHFSKPTWYPIEAEYIKVPFGVDVAHGIPICNLIIATYWDHIQACIETGIAPVVYFEQGDAHLFDYASIKPDILEFVHKQFELPSFIITVSNRAAAYIKKHYKRETTVFHNALNTQVFHAEGVKHIHPKPYILMLGSDQTEFKGLPDIIKAHKMIRANGLDYDLLWITPNQPTTLHAEVEHIFINPPQEKIGELYSGASLYVSGSHYEAFPLPGLEAMSCGCPVVTTANSGVKEYAVDGVNSLFAEIANPNDLSEKMLRVLTDEGQRETLINGGLDTAGRFSWEEIIPKIYRYYQMAAGYSVQAHNSSEDWNIFISDEQFGYEDQSKKFYAYLNQTKADMVSIPVIYSAIPNMNVARWEPAAERKHIREGIAENYYCKISASEGTKPAYRLAHHYYATGDFQLAYEQFVALIKQEINDDTRLVYLRWVVLCLIEMDQCDKAITILSDTLNVQKNNSDLYYLYMVLNSNEIELVQSCANVIEVLGEAVSFPEFFENVDIKMIGQ